MRVACFWMVGLVMAIGSSPAPAQNAEGGPAFTCRNTDGFEAEDYVFELQGRVRPSGTVSYSFVLNQNGPMATYAVSSHKNDVSQGPSTPLTMFFAQRTFDMPRWSRVTLAATSMMWDEIASRSAGIVVAQMSCEDGVAYVVVEVQSTYPEPGNGYLALHQANILATRATLEAATNTAQSVAVAYEEAATAMWLDAGFAAGDLSAPGLTEVPLPIPQPKIPNRRIVWQVPPGFVPLPPPEESCMRGAVFPADRLTFTNPYEVDVQLAGASWVGWVDIRCRACELTPPILCTTGNPMWDVKLIIRGQLRRGNYWFDLKIDSQHEWHIAGPPDGPVGDQWGKEVYWSAQLKESFPLKSPYWDPGPLPPSHYWQRQWHCRRVVTCAPD